VVGFNILRISLWNKVVNRGVSLLEVKLALWMTFEI
jgi:hypothetical protein